MKSLKIAASEELKLLLDFSQGARMRLKSPTKATGPERLAKTCTREDKKACFWGVEARAIDIYNGKGKVVGAPREGRSDGKVVDGMAEEMQLPIVPSSSDATGSAYGGFENQRAKRLRQKRGGGEGGDIGELRFLEAKNGWESSFNGCSNIISLAAQPEAPHIPAIKQNLN
jgi:hypothetical protein